MKKSWPCIIFFSKIILMKYDCIKCIYIYVCSYNYTKLIEKCHITARNYCQLKTTGAVNVYCIAFSNNCIVKLCTQLGSTQGCPANLEKRKRSEKFHVAKVFSHMVGKLSLIASAITQCFPRLHSCYEKKQTAYCSETSLAFGNHLSHSWDFGATEEDSKSVLSLKKQLFKNVQSLIIIFNFFFFQNLFLCCFPIK